MGCVGILPPDRIRIVPRRLVYILSRPLYETKSQVAVETANGKKLAEAKGWTIHKLPRRMRLDWYCEAGEQCQAIVEHKFRTFDYEPEDGWDVMVSLDKMIAGIELAAYLDVPFYYMVDFNGGHLAWVQVESIASSWVKWGGRTRQKRDDQDAEPCLYIPQKVFDAVVDVDED